MTKDRTNGSRAATLACVGLAAMLLPLAAQAQDEANATCRRAIGTELARWAERTVDARQQCMTRSAIGLLAPDTDCSATSTDSLLARRLQRNDRRLERMLILACGGADFTLLSYPGPCPDPSGDFDAETLSDCIRAIGGAAVDGVLAAHYPSSLSVFRGPARTCVASVATHARRMLALELRTRLQCRLARELGEIPQAVDCLALPQPFGPGTGDSSYDAALSRAYLRWLSRMPASCARADLSAMGYDEDCPGSHANAFDVHDLKRCVFDGNLRGAFVLGDLAFPSDPVCGNGIPQEGEGCDDGQANSDTAPNACRTDCTLPRCGDAVTDQGETCDDGDHTPLDGCNGACQAEFCGDGITNDSPPEQCDDGNASNGDLCASCRDAVCGDGFVCTAAACTSGPGGGAEQCDDGSANGPDAACQNDCSGFRYTCQVTFGITSGELLGGATYQVDYPSALGTLLGSGTSVSCTNLVQGALSTFFDNDGARRLRHSVILPAGFQAPLPLARCAFATGDAALAASVFAMTLVDASDPNFQPLQPALAVTSIVCE